MIQLEYSYGGREQTFSTFIFYEFYLSDYIFYNLIFYNLFFTTSCIIRHLCISQFQAWPPLHIK